MYAKITILLTLLFSIFPNVHGKKSDDAKVVLSNFNSDKFPLDLFSDTKVRTFTDILYSLSSVNNYLLYLENEYSEQLFVFNSGSPLDQIEKQLISAKGRVISSLYNLIKVLRGTYNPLKEVAIVKELTNFADINKSIEILKLDNIKVLLACRAYYLEIVKYYNLRNSTLEIHFQNENLIQFEEYSNLLIDFRQMKRKFYITNIITLDNLIEDIIKEKIKSRILLINKNKTRQSTGKKIMEV